MNDMASKATVAVNYEFAYWFGKGKSSLRQAAFRSMKSTHTRTCPFFLRTGTMLEMKSTGDISL